MTIRTGWLRRLHRWIGLVIGIQVLLWAVSGAMMAVLDMEAVAGGEQADPPSVASTNGQDGWADVQRQLAATPITAASVQPLLDRWAFHVTTPSGVRLFDAASGVPVTVGASLAARIAFAAHPDKPQVRRVEALDRLELAVREHELPIWSVEFADRANSTYYVSGATGDLLERRNDSWRLWDFFWMLHTMDYARRTDFNHPLIILFGFAAVWLAITGFYLLFRTGWRSDFKRRRSIGSDRATRALETQP